MLILCWASIGPCLADVSYWICLYWCVRVRGFYELCHLLCWPRTWNPRPVSRMRSTGSRFTLHGGLWVEGVLARRCAPSTTIRVRAVWRCFWRVLKKRSLFGGFKHRIASFRVAGMALCDMQTCFITCRKSFFVTCTILLRRFQIFSWQAQHFGDLHGHFAWQALRLNMTC